MLISKTRNNSNYLDCTMSANVLQIVEIFNTISCNRVPSGNEASKTKTNEPHCSRIGFRTKSEVDILDDGFKWRKYGKKAVKNSPNPRYHFFIRISKTWHALKHVRSSYKKYLEKTEPMLLKQDCVQKIWDQNEPYLHI
jgi:WRKY DNA -binding domain